MRLGEAKMALGRADIVLLTHLHMDHAGDLPGLFKARAVSGRRPVEFKIFGPAGRRALNAGRSGWPAAGGLGFVSSEVLGRGCGAHRQGRPGHGARPSTFNACAGSETLQRVPYSRGRQISTGGVPRCGLAAAVAVAVAVAVKDYFA